ncbi:glyoxylase-like metal-dependent hydrolase (beta-lactamase superfamily II) [Desulfitispora alkaliphila]|uniref:MBL fold metallo-hydrolase n=1 Tax=Desulfitispora alkaliphila TaxID=622674 RepID=UPI003D1AA225
MERLKVGGVQLTWLRGGAFQMDGGAMFGVVPKALWSKKYPVNEKNQIPQYNSPILVEASGKKILIDTGVGSGKLSEKQKRNFGCLAEGEIEESLRELNLTVRDIDYVLLTHMHFDHAGGLTKPVAEDEYEPVFPNAEIVVSEPEWAENTKPNMRSRNTYWKQNWEAARDQVSTFVKSREVVPEVKIIHTGGHSQGHSIIVIKSGEDMAIHMGDLMATNAHFYHLWVMAYDDYPMESIYLKKDWNEEGILNNAWFTFYHDTIYSAAKWDKEGNITSVVERKKQLR